MNFAKQSGKVGGADGIIGNVRRRNLCGELNIASRICQEFSLPILAVAVGLPAASGSDRARINKATLRYYGRMASSLGMTSLGCTGRQSERQMEFPHSPRLNSPNSPLRQNRPKRKDLEPVRNHIELSESFVIQGRRPDSWEVADVDERKSRSLRSQPTALSE